MKKLLGLLTLCGASIVLANNTMPASIKKTEDHAVQYHAPIPVNQDSDGMANKSESIYAGLNQIPPMSEHNDTYDVPPVPPPFSVPNLPPLCSYRLTGKLQNKYIYTEFAMRAVEPKIYQYEQFRLVNNKSLPELIIRIHNIGNSLEFSIETNTKSEAFMLQLPSLKQAGFKQQHDTPYGTLVIDTLSCIN